MPCCYVCSARLKSCTLRLWCFLSVCLECFWLSRGLWGTPQEPEVNDGGVGKPVIEPLAIDPHQWYITAELSATGYLHCSTALDIHHWTKQYWYFLLPLHIAHFWKRKRNTSEDVTRYQEEDIGHWQPAQLTPAPKRRDALPVQVVCGGCFYWLSGKGWLKSKG